jgi:hypothetical protein
VAQKVNLLARIIKISSASANISTIGVTAATLHLNGKERCLEVCALKRAVCRVEIIARVRCCSRSGTATSIFPERIDRSSSMQQVV